ncbi:MAG: diguanylate cyclase [Pseudomonadota bacterium]
MINRLLAWEAVGGMAVRQFCEGHFIQALRPILVLVTLALSGLPGYPLKAEEQVGAGTLRFGVFTYLGEEQTRKQYQPIADYLNERLAPVQVVLEVLPQSEIDQRVKDGTLDLVTTNPTHFLSARAQQPLTGVIATLVELNNGQPQYRLGGVIVVRASRSDIRELADVRGKSIGIPGQFNLGGFRAQAYELLAAGISLPDDARELVPLSTHQAVVQAVLDGRVELGFVRSGTLEKMQAAGAIQSSDLRVLNPKRHEGFSLMSSTRLYPEWPVFALPHVDESLVRKVAAALFTLEPDHPAAKAAGIYGYTIPADYLVIEELTRRLRLPPYDHAPDFTFRDVLQRWKNELMVGLFGLVIIAYLVARLISVLKRETRLRAQHQRLLNSLGEGVYGTDAEGRCTFINQAALQMLRLTETDAIGHNQHDLFHHHLPDGQSYPQKDCPIDKTTHDGVERRIEEWFFRRDGEGFPVSLTVSPIHDKGEVVGSVVVFQDITERKRMERELMDLATTDPLTSLPNRRYFMQSMEKELARIQRTTATDCLLMFDLDHFKRINDQYGHAAGDLVLTTVAEVLRAELRQGDVAGRLGGEEFAVLLPETDLSHGHVVAERLRTSLEATALKIANEPVRITASIGCAEIRSGETSVDEALARVDRALYRAKTTGRNRVVLEA